MKKHILLIALAVVIVAGAMFLSVLHWQHYRNLKLHADAVAAEQQTKDHQAEVARQSALVQSYNALYGECQKGVVAFNALPAANKGKNAAPACGAQLIQ